MRDSLLATGCEGIPKSFDEDVVVGSWHDGDVASSGVANLGAVARYFDIHIRYHGRVISGIRDIDHRLERKGGLCCIQDAERAHLGRKAIEITARYSWLQLIISIGNAIVLSYIHKA